MPIKMFAGANILNTVNFLNNFEKIFFERKIDDFLSVNNKVWRLVARGNIIRLDNSPGYSKEFSLPVVPALTIPDSVLQVSLQH
jgi:hypothetical protein